MYKNLTGQDGKQMVLIPTGVFSMGSDNGYAEERPVQTVNMAAFYMDVCPVTNAEYKAFCDATETVYPQNPRWPEYPDYFTNYPDYPVVNVSWSQAVTYAAWAGKRLPTEEEWEYAARGGLVDQPYPWGTEPPTGARANFADSRKDYVWKDSTTSCGFVYTSPVGRFPANGYGLHDMAGNVFQWTADWFFLYSDTVHDMESFKDGWGGSRVCRGGCYHSTAFDLRVSRRRQVLGGGPTTGVGFRCVRDVEPAERVAAIPAEARPKPAHELPADLNLNVVDDMQLCVGASPSLTPADARRIRQLGFKSVEQYVTWETLENAGEGEWDFSHWDEQVAILKAEGLKWVPFLIAGPAYALPDWYRRRSGFTGLRCLEHNIESKIESIWDPAARPYVRRYLKAFAEHYLPMGVIQNPLLGITGDFGEALYSAWHGNWTTIIPGLYHAHRGYWCYDPFARQDFIRYAAERYATIAELNAAWGTQFPAFEAVTMPELQLDEREGFRVDEVTQAGMYPYRTAADRRRWVDFVDRYRDSMTDYANFWMKTCAKLFPDHTVYLCTGGHSEPYLGSQFAAQCKVAAKYGGGVRITNEASVYLDNFVVTNWVASASEFYGAEFGFEPAGQVTEHGLVRRIYNATATGADELHFYDHQAGGTAERVEVFQRHLPFLRRRKIIRELGVLYPDLSVLMVDALWSRISDNLGLLRRFDDYRYVDDVAIADGMLDRVKAMVVFLSDYYRAATLDRLLKWVRRGGVLVGYDLRQMVGIEDDRDRLGDFFGAAGVPRKLGKGQTLRLDVSAAETLAGPDADARLFKPMAEFMRSEGVVVSDGQYDDVFVARTQTGHLLLSTTSAAVEKEIWLPDGTTRKVRMEPNTIMELTS